MVLAANTYHNQATYWGNPTQGGYGGITYDAPRLIMVRWEDRVESFTTIEGTELRSKAVVHTQEHLEMGAYIAKGDHTAEGSDPTEIAGALEVQRSDDIPDLRGLNNSYRSFL